MFKAELMKKTETSLPTPDTERSISNSMLFMLTNGRENQPRDNSTKTSVFMLKDHSTSFHTCQEVDISMSLPAMLWLSRQEMVENLKSGGSIKDH
jgi:hypothetical protein